MAGKRAQRRETQRALAALAASAIAAAPAVLAAPAQPAEKGISGTINYSGNLLPESNAKLQHQQAFGTPGNRTWGEWEKIARTDPDVAAGLDFIMGPLRDARVDVKPAIGGLIPDALARQQADFVRANLLEMLEPSWAEVLQQIGRGSLTFGFSLHEEVYGETQHPLLPGGRGYFLRKLAERLPVSVSINGWLEEEYPDGSVELRAVRQQGPGVNGKFRTVELEARRLLLVSWNRSGNNYQGFSVWRPVWYLCQVRAELAKLIGISSVRESAGIPVAEVDKDTNLTVKQRRSLERFLANMVLHENANVVLPPGVKLNWLYSPGANKGHVVETYNQLGVAILRQVQAQQMALGTGDTGSRSVGEVHSATAQAFVQGVVANIEGAINGVGRRPYTGLIRKLVQANWGPQAAYPTVSLILKKPQLKPLDKAQAAKVAVEAGLLKPTREDENVFREELGLSSVKEAVDEAQAGTTILNGAQIQVAQAIVTAVAAGELPRDSAVGMLQQFFGLTPEAAAQVLGSAGLGVAPIGGVATAPAPGPQPARAQLSRRKATRLAGFTPKRPLRPAETVLDLAAMDSFLNRARDDFERGVKPLLAEALMRLQPAIREAMKDGDPSEVVALQLDTTRLDAFVGEYLERCRAEGFKSVKGEKERGTGEKVAEKRAEGDQRMAPVRMAEEDDDARPKVDDVQPPAPTPPSKTRKVLDAQRKQLVRRITDKTLSDVQAEAIEVIRTDGDPDEVVMQTLQHQVESGALKQDASLVLTKAFNMGRDEFAKAYGDEVESAQYSAILDGDQCEECDELDGEEFDFGSAEYEANAPPNRRCHGGPRCRCIYVFTWKDGGGFQKEEEDADA